MYTCIEIFSKIKLFVRALETGIKQDPASERVQFVCIFCLSCNPKQVITFPSALSDEWVK
jgi:hypothetical protein